MQKILLFSFPFLLLFAAYELVTASAPDLQSPGLLDIRQRQIDDDTLIPLSGKWAFFWQEFIPPDEVFVTPNPIYVPAATSWTNYESLDSPLPPTGYATYGLKLLLPDAEQPYGLYMTPQGNAYTLWIDGQEVASNGRVATTRTDMIAQKIPTTAFFQPTQPEVEIVLHISNYHHQRFNGLNEEILLGTATAVHQHYVRLQVINTIFFAIYITIGIYHIALYLFWRQNRSPLYFAFLCLMVAFYVGFTGPNIIPTSFPIMSWDLALRIEYFIFYWVIVAFATFMYSLYPEDFSKYFVWLTAVTAIIYTIPLFFLDLLTLSRMLPSFQLLNVLQLFYFPYILGRILYYRRQDAWLISLAALVSVLAGAFDILANQVVIPFGSAFRDVARLTFVFFIGIQAVLLALRFSRAFHLIRRMQVDLRQSERKYRTIFEESQDMIFLADQDWQIKDVSPACVPLLGYERQTLQGMTLPQLGLSPEKAIALQQTLQQQTAIQDFETTLQRADGQGVDVALTAVMRRDEAPKTVSIQGIVRDITDKKAAEVERIRTLEMQKAKETAEAANQAKSEFLANMSHELRTPLNGILGFTQILQQRDRNQADKDGLQTIYKSGQHLLTLINDILDLSRIEAGKLSLQPHPINLPLFLENIANLMRISATQARLTFRYEPTAYLPPYVEVDEKRLRQILLNLLGNAVKFTPQGRVTFTVIARPPETAATDCWVQFLVTDTGVGITKAQLITIFEPFEQVSEMTQRQQGVGLGLAISQQIAELMGSEIKVESELGQGSRFWFELSLPIAADAPVEVAPLPKIKGYQGDRRHILVVDDQEANRSVMLGLLAPLGFEVSLAANGQEALLQIAKTQPHLIFMDMIMPVMTGFEAVQIIRQQEKASTPLPIIAVSASVLDEDIGRIQNVGCNDFLPKPVEAQRMLALVQKHLRLEWIYSDDAMAAKDEAEMKTAVSPATTLPFIIPPLDTLKQLHQLAQEGYMLRIQEVTEQLAAKNPAYAPFIQHITQLG